jgi:PilZ domain
MAEKTKTRSAERIPYPCDVQCVGSDGLGIANTRLSDLSTTGAFVESMNELPVGTRLRLRFQLGGRTIDVGAEIVHSMPQFGFGVRFEELGLEDRVAIAELVAGGA